MERRKAQGEMVGLVVIFIIIAVAIVFLLMLTNKLNERSSTVTADRQLATSFVNTLLETKIYCDDRNFKDVVEDCINSWGVGYVNCNDGTTTCKRLNESVTMIMENSLEKWDNGNKYEVKIGKKTGDNDPEFLMSVIAGKDIKNPKTTATNPFYFNCGYKTDCIVFLCIGGCPPVVEKR